MKPKIILFPFLFILTAGFAAFKIEDGPLAALLIKLEGYNRDNPVEKVYLHLDKPYYAVGDNIWFKAYVTDQNNQLSELSTELYIELIDEKDAVVKQIKLPLSSGLSWGDFKLTDDLQEGNYRIRAYTRWMRNAGPDYFFDKILKIGDSWSNTVFTTTSYSFSKKETADEVKATIKFTDKQGDALKGRPVFYSVNLQDKITDKGSGTTDDQGELKLSFVHRSTGKELVAGNIIALITLANKNRVSKFVPLNTISNAISVKFFPESGNLIQGVSSKVTFKAIQMNGLGKEVDGTVVDNDGKEILTFKSTHLGMGSFILNPQPGKTYKAKIRLENGRMQDQILPLALSAGYVLSVDNSEAAQITANITCKGLLVGAEMKLLLQHNDHIDTVINLKDKKESATILIPKKNRPSGIYRFTLFDSSAQPVCERMIFIRNAEEEINLSLHGLQKSYGKRENIKFEVSAKNAGMAARGTFSIAVTHTGTIEPDPDHESNIITSLLLTSDLKGYVEEPNYYLNNDNSQSRSDLDNLMLSQGWSRYSWKAIALKPTRAIFAPETSQQLSGTVTTLGNKPLPGARVSLASTTNGYFSMNTLTDNRGRFNFINLSFAEGTKFVLQAFNAKNKNNVSLQLDTVPGQVVTRSKNTAEIELNVNETIQSYVKKSESFFDQLTRRGLLEHSINLKEVNISAQKTQAKNSSNLNGPGNADFIFTTKDLQFTNNLFIALDNLMAGVTIKNNEPYLISGSGSPMIIDLDGFRVKADILLNLDLQEIESIEVLKEKHLTAMYGAEGDNGVLVITTLNKSGGLPGKKMNGIMKITPKGYYKIREFYSPEYIPGYTETEEDRRSTIYWKPGLITNAEGKVTISFFSADAPGTYRIVIEGIDNAGHLARTVQTCQIK